MIKQLSGQSISQSEWGLYGGIKSFDGCADLIECLRHSGPNDIVVLKINSPGGRVDVGTMIVQAIMESEAMVVADVVYPSASMAAEIALACDRLILRKHTYLMFHTYSYGVDGKSLEISQHVANSDKCLMEATKDIMMPFFTAKELKDMHDGKDIYIAWNDPTLKARIKRHFKHD